MEQARRRQEDNLAVESSRVETAVLPAPAKTLPSLAKPVKQPPPVKRTYNSGPPVPKFIIKPAGPSQQFGWVGHGRYAPLNIPNIFAAAGLATRWTPGVDPLFEAGFSYPAPPAPAQDKVRVVEPEQEAKPAVTTSTVPPPAQPVRELPALPPPYEAPKGKLSILVQF